MVFVFRNVPAVIKINLFIFNRYNNRYKKFKAIIDRYLLGRPSKSFQKYHDEPSNVSNKWGNKFCHKCM